MSYIGRAPPDHPSPPEERTTFFIRIRFFIFHLIFLKCSEFQPQITLGIFILRTTTQLICLSLGHAQKIFHFASEAFQVRGARGRIFSFFSHFLIFVAFLWKIRKMRMIIRRSMFILFTRQQQIVISTQ